MPDLALPIQSFIRAAYGILLAGTLVWALPHGRRFFISERWGGYGESAPGVDVIQNPVIYPVVMVTWFACAALLVWGRATVWAALVSLVLCWYFFVWMRWKGVARGMGAPGFMTYWLAAAVFLLEYALCHGPELRSLVLLVLQVDFALIMISAGFYKFTAGYPQNHGVELGLANPQWGYWWRWYSKLSPDHWWFRMLNHLAWATEVTAGVLMLLPPTRALGAALIIASFLFIATQIRLGLLCEMVMVASVLYFHPGSWGDLWLTPVAAATMGEGFPPAAWPKINALLAVMLWSYLVLLPLAYGGLFYNFYVRSRLPEVLQWALDFYTSFFGIIIWRVFSVDIVNFFILIYHQPRTGGDRTLVSRYGLPGSLRYSHVCESVTITNIFTTLKYHPSNPDLFRSRLLRYARTVPCPADAVLVFEYISIRKAPHRFEFVPVAEYIVNVAAGTVEEHLVSDPSALRAHPLSPVHESARPGSYAPLGG